MVKRIAWNKGKKGCTNSGSFKKGHKGFYKGKFLPIEQIKKLYIEKRWSLSDIAKKFYVTPQGIHYQLNKHNIPLREKGSQTKKSKQKISNSNKGRNFGYKFQKGHKDFVSKKSRKIIGIKNSKKLKGRIITKDWREKISKSMKGKKLTKEHIKKSLRRRTSSSLELKMIEIIEKYGLPYKFVGNGKFFIERKNPDFINVNGEKIALEVFYRKHKEIFSKGLEKWKEEREKIFNEYGWKLMFFNELEVNEENVIRKLRGD